jgi:hypothetical protein
MSRWSLLIALITSIGIVDGAIDRDWDHVALFAATLCATAVAWASTGRQRRIAVRGDLGRWIAQYASEGLESEQEVVDRALALFRAGMVGGPGVLRSGSHDSVAGGR